MVNQRKKHFLFDLDGVIIDSMPIHTEAWITYLEKFGISADRVVERMHGRRNDQIVRDLFGVTLSEEEVFDHGASKEALFREMVGAKLEQLLVPGIREFLQAHAGRGLGLGSNAEPDNVNFVLDRAELRLHFQSVVDGHQVAHPKPDPDIYLLLASKFAVLPEQCVVFEDSSTGVTAALRAGMQVVGVGTSEEKLAGVEFMVRDFRDPNLTQWLQSL